jgi:hypothetical protein
MNEILGATLGEIPDAAVGCPTSARAGLRREGAIVELFEAKNVFSAATGFVLFVSGGFQGTPTNAGTALLREPNKLADADTKPPESRRYVVVRDRANEARQILSDSIRRYRQPDGYEGYLVEAAWEMEQAGADAWPVLTELVSAQIPETEFFLGAIVRLGGVETKARLRVLRVAARSPHSNVRSRLIEVVDEMPDDQKLVILRALGAAGNPEDDVTDRARLRLVDLMS